MSERPPAGATFIKLAWCCLLASVIMAALLFPVVGGLGLVSNRASDVVANGSAQLVEGQVPAVTTMVDAKGNTIAWLYSQRRFEVPSDKIADTMKLAIVSIEDKRFAEHNGVDVQGTLTGLAGFIRGDADTRGGSTIEQQYVKNYQLLVLAQTDAEKRAAVETTPARKLREIRMALTLDKTFTKPEILTRYLNLVSFGNGAFGIQDAAQTYFGIDASALNWQQSALLAGLVQSTSTLNPYTNPDGALARRNLVLDTMIENLPDRADELRAAKQEPLGILPQPNELPRGCIAAGDRAFFCDYVQEYLARAGLSKDQIAKGGYLIKTTLDPDVQGSVKSAVDSLAPPDINGIASVMSVILPGKTAHPVVAMVSNRTYGLDTAAGETVQPQPFSLVGDGAGSIFKIFTTAAAMDMGLGIGANLDAPVRFEAKGLGSGGARGCPSNTWCVQNAGNYRGSMSVTDALAQSPNTAFAKLISQVGVQRTVDMAVKLGLRSYAEPGTARPYDPETNESLADYIKRYNLGSFTLGPIEVNALELSNVAATLASGGMWCPPNPIDKVYDRLGNEVAVTTETCDQVVPEGLANTLSNALSKDDTNGTAANSAGSVGWGLPMSGKTGTTEAHRSSGFLGYTNRYAAASYIYDDSPNPTDLCSWPLRQCGDGNLYGGNEPAKTWFSAMKPIAESFGDVTMPPTDPRYVDGAPGSRVPSVSGLSQDSARERIKESGFQVADQANPINSASPYGTVVGTSPGGQTVPGSIITILISNGIPPAPPPPPPGAPPPPPDGEPPPAGSTVVEIPGLPPITVPLLAPPPPP
ncbi:MAG TPA: transglycosylase/D,D-transpeptidase PonA2 [Mycobacterium sp.]|nr:transglycosylase/D,D-transpeptidase PonA2 [Mycobacterium sp.]HNF05365.1 transglycosylase/D,D-transpeptidase PonA2 [Mycobacterium sp.]HNM10094.1 transglycosylase/D,D-transpeptidase PonA2 [Mycobacterium sp.]HNM93360.1 transglycosylase/D,D-transpeptidase PonA2 [Mycobacterium sp.]HNP14276.1 transglycosylase/D,D-transpeptidase PonA2 [Mycobacterium sp.]